MLPRAAHTWGHVTCQGLLLVPQRPGRSAGVFLPSGSHHNVHSQYCLRHLNRPYDQQKCHSMNLKKRCRQDFPHTAKRPHTGSLHKRDCYRGSTAHSSSAAHPLSRFVFFYPIWVPAEEIFEWKLRQFEENLSTGVADGGQPDVEFRHHNGYHAPLVLILADLHGCC